MTLIEANRAKSLAQELVEICSSYEEELIELERRTPALAPLRRAVGATIAEACYWIAEGAQAVEPRTFKQ